MKGKNVKRMKLFVAVLVLMAEMLCVPFAYLQAATNSQLKNININWDLKNNKGTMFKTSYIQADSKGRKIADIRKSGTLTMKNYKVTNAKKTGYKTMTCVMEFKPEAFSKSQAKKAGNWFAAGGTSYGGGFYVAAVDYATGESLMCKNSHNVTVKYGKWKGSKEKKYSFSKGWFKEYQINQIRITVTYPQNYENLCILAGGFTSTYEYCGKTVSNVEIYPQRFFDGTVPFKYATVMYAKNDKQYCHGIHVK